MTEIDRKYICNTIFVKTEPITSKLNSTCLRYIIFPLAVNHLPTGVYHVITRSNYQYNKQLVLSWGSLETHIKSLFACTGN